MRTDIFNTRNEVKKQKYQKPKQSLSYKTELDGYQLYWKRFQITGK